MAIAAPYHFLPVFAVFLGFAPTADIQAVIGYD
jgi:hypothetical protein